jgi:uncharacterized protein (TIGR03000 family)
MKQSTRTWTARGLVLLTALAVASAVRAQTGEQPISIRLLLPGGAEVEFDGTKTTSTGESRLYTSPPVAVGRDYHYTLKVLAGGKTVMRTIAVRPGADNTFDLRAEFQVAEVGGTPRSAATEGRQRTPVGKLEGARGTLFSRASPQAKWQVVDAGGDVYAGDILVGLPGAVVSVKDGAVALTFQTDFDSPLPVMECGLILHQPTDGDADLTLDRGRVDLTNRKKDGPAKVRVRSHGETWTIALTEPGASLAAEVYGRWPRGSRFVKNPGPKDVPWAQMLFLVLKGQADLAFQGTEVLMSAPPGLAAIQWDSQYGMDRAPQYLKELPSWATRAGQKRSPEEQAKYKAARDLFIRVASEKGPDAAMDALLGSDDPIARRVGVIAAGALDELPRLGAFFRKTKHVDLLDEAILVFRNWTGRGPGQDQKMYQALIDRGGFSPLEAESVMQLLHGFNDQELAEPETYELLIRYLTDSRLAIRALAHWHLVRMVPAGRDIAYNPLDDKAALQKAQKEWEKLIPAGTVPGKKAPSQGK